MNTITNKAQSAAQLEQLAKKKIGVTVKRDVRGWPESMNFSRINGNYLISITLRREYQDKSLGVAQENPLKYCSRIVPNAKIEIINQAETGCTELMERTVLLPDGQLDGVKEIIAESYNNPKGQVGKAVRILLPKFEEMLNRHGNGRINEKQLREILSIAKRNCEDIAAFIK